MIAEFVFFVCIAAICFSGLLFTLHTLSAGGSNPWNWRSIAWLMVQVWFGNTYLSFTQASSFHPIFGPFLMTGFAALSNTLLLTSKFNGVGACVRKPQGNSTTVSVLISILSNTFARIDAVCSLDILDLVDPLTLMTPTECQQGGGRFSACGRALSFTDRISATSTYSSSP